ncbi:MAG: GLPGLI family protein [Sphingobacteriales bacterium]|uniref:GLPGLI family protein n=1 Tax=Hydrotalea flava TaxID=714549 RepID=UPI00082E4F82|nr:GLPGLI family protein [Hydrotalea flava]RTL55821.1 MAG: GLPGLI family protein [Sphingobacteriales bacterium]
MKKIILYFAFLIFCNALLSQKHPETILGKVTYEFVHKTDTASNYLHKEIMVLLYGNEMSEYFSLTKQMQDSMMKQKLEDAMRTGTNNVDFGNMVITNPQIIFFNRFNKKLWLVEEYRNTRYMMFDMGNVPQWQIQKETRLIDGYTCQSAITNFRGRKYTAWFTTSIPLAYGPWKLNGLPGLILEAYDATKEVQFNFRWLVQAKNLGTLVLPNHIIATTIKDFKKMQLAYQQGGAQDNNIQMNGIQISDIKLSGGNNRLKKWDNDNNPIELKNN